MAPAARLEDATLAPYVSLCSGHSLAPPRHPGDNALEGEDAQALGDLERVLFSSREEGGRRTGCRRVDTKAAVPEGTRDNRDSSSGGLGGVGEARDVVDDLCGDGIELRPERRAGRPRAEEVGDCRPEPRRGKCKGITLMKATLDEVQETRGEYGGTKQKSVPPVDRGERRDLDIVTSIGPRHPEAVSSCEGGLGTEDTKLRDNSTV
jgi:hypothetical protein